MFRVCRSIFAVEHSFCHRQFYSRRNGGRSDYGQGRWHTHSLLPLRRRPGDMALDDLFRGTANRPYNVGSANPVNIAETAAAVSRALPGNVPVNILQKPIPGAPTQRSVPDTTRAQNELGLKQFIQLDDAIQRTARWHSRI